LRDRFDMVIYDTAPVELVTDAVVVGRVVDGVVLVVSAESTSRDELTSSIETLRSSHVELLGTVLSTSRVRGAQAQPYPPTERRSRGRGAPLQEEQERDAVGESGTTGEPSRTPAADESDAAEATADASATKAGVKSGFGTKLRS
jgi:Mrp family chromosome partitioning ATPase